MLAFFITKRPESLSITNGGGAAVQIGSVLYSSTCTGCGFLNSAHRCLRSCLLGVRSVCAKWYQVPCCPKLVSSRFVGQPREKLFSRLILVGGQEGVSNVFFSGDFI